MRRRLSVIALVTLLSFAGPATFSQERQTDAERLQESFIKISEEVGPSVVSISSLHVGQVYTFTWRGPTLDDFMRDLLRPVPGESYRIPTGLGSGFIIDEEGNIITNEHVIRGADEIEVTLADGRKFKGVVKGADATADLALIKIEAQNLPKVELGDSASVRTGEWILAIGNPFAFGMFSNNPMPTVTVGVVSAVHRTLSRAGLGGRYYGDLIQTDAAINPGNSGGPLVNLKGEVIGINAAIISPSGASAGIGFAIPVNRAKDVLPYLKKEKVQEKGWLGVAIQAVDSGLARNLDLPDTMGLLVHKVIENSPAEASGLKQGDVIRTYNGAPVYSPEDLIWRVTHTSPNESATVLIIRDGEEMEIEVRIGSRGERTT